MSEKRKRQISLKCRLSAQEQQEIQSAAKRVGMSPASFLRQATLAASRDHRLSAQKPEQLLLRDLIAEVERIGHVTRKRAVTKADADRVTDQLRRLLILIFRFHRGEQAT